MPRKFLFQTIACFLIITALSHSSSAQTEPNRLLNEPIDISPDFHSFVNAYFLADSLTAFDPVTMTGTVEWQRNHYVRRIAFNNELAALQPYQNNIFPATEYQQDPVLPFSIQFVSPRTIRLRMNTGLAVKDEKDT